MDNKESSESSLIFQKLNVLSYQASTLNFEITKLKKEVKRLEQVLNSMNATKADKVFELKSTKQEINLPLIEE